MWPNRTKERVATSFRRTNRSPFTVTLGHTLSQNWKILIKWISPKYSEVSNEFKWKYNHEAETDVFAALNFDCLWKLSQNTFGLPPENFDRGFMYHWYPSDLPVSCKCKSKLWGSCVTDIWLIWIEEHIGTLYSTVHLGADDCRLGICQKIYTTQFSGEGILHTENA